MASTANTQLAWQDKFRTPELDELREHYPKPMRAQFDEARARILAFEGAEERLEWNGLPWRWCLRYTIPNDPTRTWCYLVPDPEKPKIGVPFTGEMLRGMPLHRFKRYVRDILVASHDVGGMFWSEFDVSGKSLLDDAMDLVKRKHTMIKKQ